MLIYGRIEEHRQNGDTTTKLNEDTKMKMKIKKENEDTTTSTKNRLGALPSKVPSLGVFDFIK